MLTIFYGWLSFWINYWIVGSLLLGDSKAKEITPSQSVNYVVFRNMMLSLPYGCILYLLTPKFDISYSLIRFLLSILVMDAWFYGIHRLLHTEYLYQYHKQHHEFTYTYPLVAVYCSVFEALICDVTAFSLGPIMFKMNSWEMILFTAVSAWHVLLLHSIFDYNHRLHHKHYKYNFSICSIMDIMFNTYR